MIPPKEGTLLALTGGVMLRQRVQRPKIHERKERGAPYWYFRYWHDELLPDGTVKTTRKRHLVGPSKGPNALTRRQAEVERDRFLANRNAAPTPCEAAIHGAQPVEVGAILFGNLAEMWRRDYVDNPKVRLAESTRARYRSSLDVHILPRWKDVRLAAFRAKEVLDWLHQECTSWHSMIDLRNVMSGIFTKAQEWEILPETYANPIRRVKVGRKWTVRPERILTEEETIEVLSHLEDPHLLICETCIYCGTRISEALGLQLRHVDLDKGVIRIEQRHCRGDIDEPKTEKSRRTLSLGMLVARYRDWLCKKGITKANQWVFPQEPATAGPMWDTTVRSQLKKAAQTAGCDFPGFGLHSFRRANITWRQEVGGSAIEAAKIAGHATPRVTEDYTIVQLKRQEELTRRIQQRLAQAKSKPEAESQETSLVPPSSPETPPGLAAAEPATRILQ
jgi:integrase